MKAIINATLVMRDHLIPDAVLLIDGQRHDLPADTPVRIEKSEQYMHFVSFGRENFISRLREKLS